MSLTDSPRVWNPAAGLERLGDSSLMLEIAGMLLDMMTEQQAAIAQQVQHNDYPALRLLTHSQLPSLKIMGFDDDAKVFEAFESATLKNNDAVCSALAPQVLRAWSGITQDLGTFIQQSHRSS